VCVIVRVYKYVYKCICVCVRACVRGWVCGCVIVRVYTYVYKCIYTYIQSTCLRHGHACITNACAHTHILNTNTHTHTHTYTHTFLSYPGHYASHTRTWPVDFHNGTHCNTLQHAATRCNTPNTFRPLQCTNTNLARRTSHCNTLPHTATHCDILQHTVHLARPGHYIAQTRTRLVEVYNATHCNTLQPTAPRCITLHHAATRCNTLQHTQNIRAITLHKYELGPSN